MSSTTMATAAAADHAPLLENAFFQDLTEGAYDIQEIRGTVPAYIRGSYYLNGPARFARGGERWRHWLDGDGMVCALHFDDGGVHFVNRWVRSNKLVAEEQAGRPLFRTFGTAFESDRLVHGIGLESPANVSVYTALDTLLAFGEQGLPWELDPRTLETRGVYDFGGKLNPISPFSAHANIDYGSGELFNFGISFSARQPRLNFYRFAADGGMIFRRRLPIEHPCSLHDFGLSAEYAVFYLSPHVLRMEKLMAEGGTLMDSLSWQPELGSTLLVVRRDDGETVASVPVGNAYSLHQINCFERDGLLAVDVIELDRPVYDQYEVPQLFTEVRRSQPVRYLVDLERGELAERATLPFHLMSDFPGIDPRLATAEYRDFWVLAMSATERPGRKFFDQLVHLDWQTDTSDSYQAPPRSYLGGEPVFVPDPAEPRRGAVICQQFDADRKVGAFLIFDALDIAAGPLATLRLESPVHLGFHASFEPQGGW